MLSLMANDENIQGNSNSTLTIGISETIRDDEKV